jgi:hypothetical protein
VSEETSRLGVIVCGNCGKRVRLGQRPPQEPAPEALELPALELPVAPRATAKPRPVEKPAGTGRLIAAGVVGAVVVTMIAALVIVVRHLSSANPPAVANQTVAPATQPVPPWDRAHREELLRLKSSADQLSIAGDWQQSYDGYQKIIAEVGDHDLTDPIAIQVVAATRLGQDRVLQQLIARRAPAALQAIARSLEPPRPAATTAAMTTMPTQPTTMVAVTQPSTHPSTNPSSNPSMVPAVALLDPAQAAADNASPLPGPPPEPPSLHAYTLPDSVSDAQIGDSIAKGVKFLSDHFRNGEISLQGAPAVPKPAGKPVQKPGGRAPANPRGGVAGGPSNLGNDSNLPDLPAQRPPIQSTPPEAAPWAAAFGVQGVDALCVYSLLHSGQALDGPGQRVMTVDDPFTQQILDKLKSYDLKYTYHRSLRAAAMAVFNRSQDALTLEDDVRWLLTAGPNGAYTYTMSDSGYNGGGWDNSNSQYGLLGVWSGASVGMSISQNYWHAVINHWSQCVNGNGTFGYTMGDASTTMTCAGVASLLVARDYIDYSAANSKMPAHPSPLPALDAGLRWLEDGDNCMTNIAGDGMGGVGYGLYGLERVGLASGFKYFGRHDWYSELARRLVAEQHADGSWGTQANANGVVVPQTLVDTAYALLFLARGRHPILFNKLRYDGDWNDRPNDVSHLAKFASHALERPLNWQVVNLHRSWFDWMDCPVLYISGDRAIKLTPADYMALREFANGGGMIFTHADGGSSDFNKWVAEMVRTVFPKYELMTVPRDHAVYSTVYPLKNPPPLLSVSNGSRTLLIHSPTDLAGGWQLNWTDERKLDFQLGVNVFIYAAGKGTLKNRLSGVYIPPDTDLPNSTRQIARLEYAAEWDPEPYAWARFSRFFQWETHDALQPVIVPLRSLTPGSVPLAVLTGTVRHDFTAAECLAAKGYVQAGGILLIDACGGSADFAKSVQTTLLPLAFAGSTLQPIPDDHPLLIASRPGAYDLTHPLLRSFANQNGGKNMPIQVMRYGKGWVIYSRLDLTTGLLGTQTWGILGYDPAYAQALMNNAVLWAEARSPVPAPAK